MPVSFSFDEYLLCATADGISLANLRELQTTTDYEGGMDLLEMQRVHNTWGIAARENAKLNHQQNAAQPARQPVARVGMKRRIGKRR